MKSNKGKIFWFYWERFGILGILTLTLLVFSILTPNILAVGNLLTVLCRSAIVAIPAMGMTFAICSGGFDLSVGSVVGLSTCAWAATLPVFGIVPATLFTMAVGALCGVFNGLAITKLKIATFVATLSTSIIVQSIALVVTDGSKQMISRTDNPEAKFFSQNYTLFGQSNQFMQLLLMVFVYVAGYLLYRYTRFGVYTRSVGSHQPSARTSGLPVDRTLIIVFVLTGVTASISAIITSSQLMQGAATLGVGFELDVITAVILGGTSLLGGQGNIPGSMIAAIMLALTRNGLVLLNRPEEDQRLAIGFILLFALAVNGVRELLKEAQE